MKPTTVFLLSLLVAVSIPERQVAERAVPLPGLTWRAIGPAMFAGRVADVAGVPGNRDLLYVGSASSGLYKSTNGATSVSRPSVCSSTRRFIWSTKAGVQSK